MTVIGALALLVLAGCDGDNTPYTGGTPGDGGTTATAGSPAATPAEPGGEPSVSVENVILACREKNGVQLRQFVGERIRSRVTDEEIEQLLGRGADVKLVSQSTEQHSEDGRSTATVSVRLEVERAGGTETVEREWQLEREGDGVWRFTELPECF